MKTNSYGLSSISQTPGKVVVQCQINSWMETHLKNKRTTLPPKRLKPIIIANTLASLKQQKEKLMSEQSQILIKVNTQSTASQKRSISLSVSLPNTCKGSKQGKLESQGVVVSEFNLQDIKRTQVKSRRLLIIKRNESRKSETLFEVLQGKITNNQYKGMKYMNRRLSMAKQP